MLPQKLKIPVAAQPGYCISSYFHYTVCVEELRADKLLKTADSFALRRRWVEVCWVSFLHTDFPPVLLLLLLLLLLFSHRNKVASLNQNLNKNPQNCRKLKTLQTVHS